VSPGGANPWGQSQPCEAQCGLTWDGGSTGVSKPSDGKAMYFESLGARHWTGSLGAESTEVGNRGRPSCGKCGGKS
jgi:hypothetical protein